MWEEECKKILKKEDEYKDKIASLEEERFKAAPETPKRESLAERRLRKEVRLDFVEIIFDYITVTFDSHKSLFVFNPIRFYQ